MHTKKQVAIVFGAVYGLAACSGSDRVAGPSVRSSIPHSTAEALQSVDATDVLFGKAFSDFLVATGLFTDELTTGSGGRTETLDRRALESVTIDDQTGAYASLQDARMAADVSARSLALYASDEHADRGQMYAFEGYTEIMLADLFCSGIPLSKFDFTTGDVVYAGPSARDTVYRHAVALFDSALVLAASNDSLAALARVGKARALLALGDFAGAAQTAAAVPDGAQYQVSGALGGVGTGGPQQVASDLYVLNPLADREGQVGIPYLSSHDPRTLAVSGAMAAPPWPNKYSRVDSVRQGSGHTFSYAQVVLADGVEARLIQAEAALHANDIATWLQTLNHLRATVSVPPPATSFHDTPVTLTPLTDPGTPAARLDTMFAERAKWLYLTGHRQGDLRRLIRQYDRTQQQVYPTGAYPGGGTYGTAVTAPIPVAEMRANPRFTGCLDREP